MSENLLQAAKISKGYGPKTLFRQAQFSLNQNEHVGVIGANGAGKSTLFKCMVGRIELDEGRFITKKGLRIGYLGQEENEAPNNIVEELVENETIKPIWEVKKLGNGLGLTEEHFQKKFHELSGGYRMRVQLLILLGQEPDLLLLDEPTNYLDLESLIILENFLINYRGTFLLISHDREFLKSTTDHTLEIENGEATKFAGNIEDYFEQKAMLREILEKTAKSIDDKRGEILKFAARFGAKASKAKQAQSKLKQLKKLERVEISSLPIAARIDIPEPLRIGKQALSLNNVSFGYDETTILHPFTIGLQRGDHAAVVGVNGAGKSTLLKGLSKQLAPFSGEVEYGHQVEIGYYAQHVAENLDPKSTVFEELTAAGGPDAKIQDIKNMAGSFLFSGDDVKKKISVLSGGEKARVALAQILLKKSPVLLLDEPTNHLDFHTVEALTLALKRYSGTLVVVSHDRAFIRRVSTKIIEIRDGCVDLYPGSYDEYVWSLQKGAWSQDESKSEKKKSDTEKGTNKEEKKNKPAFTGNYKEEKKKVNKEIRFLEKKIAELDQGIAEKKEAIARLNQELLECSGLEASQLAGELSRNQESIERKEGRWLDYSEKLEVQLAKRDEMENQ